MKPVKLGMIAIVALVALRLGAGWLFYREGSKKIDTGTFTSKHFFADAKGPLALSYKGMIPDVYGSVRLDQEKHRDYLDAYRLGAIQHFQFDEELQKQANASFDRAVAQVNWFFEENAEDIAKWRREAGPLEAALYDQSTQAANFRAYRADWIAQEEAKSDKQLAGWLSQIDGIWSSYEADINEMAGAEFVDYYGRYELQPPGGALGVGLIDSVIPWFTFGVGVLLVLGLFTRVAGVAGALFLAGVLTTQPPWVASAADTNYQIVLLLSLLALAAVGAGRWGGLDFFTDLAWRRCCGRGPAEDAGSA